jgi:hypothetical protein
MEKVKTYTVQPKEVEDRVKESKSALMAPPYLWLNWVASQIALNV